MATRYDLINTPSNLGLAVDLMKSYIESFRLAAHHWDKHADSYPYAWEPVKFDKSNVEKIPDKPGLYCFVIKPGQASLSEVGYLMYIGEAGHESSNTLRKRFRSYFNEKDNIKRAYITHLLNKWSNYLHFCFCVVSEECAKNIKKYETELLDTFVPTYNERDFSADVSVVIKALR